MDSCRIVIRLCRHTFANGHRCHGPAVVGRACCRHHLCAQARLHNAARARRQLAVPRLCVPETLADLARNRAEVNRVVFSGLVDYPTARQMYRGLAIHAVEVQRDYQQLLRETRRDAANPNGIYYVAANALFEHLYPQNPMQVVEDTSTIEAQNSSARPPRFPLGTRR